MKIIFHTPVGKFESRSHPESEYKKTLYARPDDLLVLQGENRVFTIPKEVEVKSIVEIIND